MPKFFRVEHDPVGKICVACQTFLVNRDKMTFCRFQFFLRQNKNLFLNKISTPI